MYFWILAASLLILPLCNIIIIEPLISITHNCKETIAIIFCLIFSTYVHFYQQSKPKKINLFLCLNMLFLIFCINASPKVKLIYGSENLGNLWEWKAFAIALVYFLFYLSFAKIDLLGLYREKLCKIIGLTGIISSIYAIFQLLGLDQAQSEFSIYQIGDHPSANITAMIGNPTYLSIYLCATLPFVWLFYKKHWSVLILIAIVSCRADTGYAGTIMMILCLVLSKIKIKLRIAIIICLSLAVITFILINKNKLVDNGRFSTWKQAISEFYNPQIVMKINPEISRAQKEEIEKLNSKKYVMTGLGLGSFPIIHNKNTKYRVPGVAFKSAHNIYLEVLFSTGIIGLILFLGTISECIYKFFLQKNIQKIDFYILFSFIFLLFASFLHSTILVEPLRFLMAFLFCLLSFNKK